MIKAMKATVQYVMYVLTTGRLCVNLLSGCLAMSRPGNGLARRFALDARKMALSWQQDPAKG